MLSDEWLSRYGLLENFNASVTRTRTRTGTGTGTWTTEVTAIALCTSCSRAKKDSNSYMYMISWYQAPDCLILVYVPGEVTIYSYQPGTSCVLVLHPHMFTSCLYPGITTFLDMTRNLEKSNEMSD